MGFEGTLGTHLASAARQRGRRLPEQHIPPLPPAAQHVFRWFLELAGRRGSGPVGPNPLGFADVAAWAALTGRSPRPWEIRILMVLDDCWLAALGPSEGASGPDGASPGS